MWQTRYTQATNICNITAIQKQAGESNCVQQLTSRVFSESVTAYENLMRHD